MFKLVFTADTVRVFILYLVALCVILYAAFTYYRISPKRIIDAAVHDSDFRQCEFVVYDKSSADVCDRLIVVKPFEWRLWNTRKQLFVLNPEKFIDCGNPNNSLGSIRVLRENFAETCLNVSAERIELEYTKGENVANSGVRIKKIPYTISGDVYTILSAVNDLVALNLLDYDPDMLSTGNDVVPAQNLYALHDLGRHIKMTANNREIRRIRKSLNSVDAKSDVAIVEHNRRTSVLQNHELIDRINSNIARFYTDKNRQS